MMNRRSLFLGLMAAPAIVRAESIMRIYVPPLILTGNLSTCEADIIEAAWAGKYVLDKHGRRVGRDVVGQSFALGRHLTVPWRPDGVWCGLMNCNIYSLGTGGVQISGAIPDGYAGDDGVWRRGLPLHRIRITGPSA